MVGDGSTLVILYLPGDGEAVRLDLVYDPCIAIGNGFSHLAEQVDDVDALLADLTTKGIAFDRPHCPGGADGPKTAFVQT